MRLDDLDTPFVAIDAEVMERNLRRAAEYAREHGLALRPHTKTHKMPEIARRQVALSGAGITVAKLGEAEVMAAAGLDDLFVAYPLVGEGKLRRLAALCRQARVRVALDSEEVAAGISRTVAAEGGRVAVLVEVDTGYRRCGVPVGPELVALCRRVQELPGLEFLGIMTYQGHIGGAPEERERKIGEENARLQHLFETLSRAGLSWQVVSGGSTPALPLLHRLPGLTEIRPGTYVFNDRNTLAVGACALEECALKVVATVVSTAVSGRAVIDAGAKSLASDRPPAGFSEGHGLVCEDPEATISMLNEEHGYVELSRATRRWRVGERVSIVPNHVCTAVNLHDQVVLHRGGEVVDTWKVAARGRVQ